VKPPCRGKSGANRGDSKCNKQSCEGSSRGLSAPNLAHAAEGRRCRNERAAQSSAGLGTTAKTAERRRVVPRHIAEPPRERGD
jgi:hypothetical protein